MNSNTNIKFEYRCDQKSSEFSRVAGNPYCQVCQTTVHNLVGKSREEIDSLLDKHNGQLCGTFYLDQIEDEPEPRRLNFSLAVASLATFFTFSTTKYFANTNEPIPIEQHDVPFLPRKFTIVPDVVTTTSKNLSIEVIPPPQRPEKSKLFMIIGKRQFYWTNKFPGIRITKKPIPVQGRMARWL